MSPALTRATAGWRLLRWKEGVTRAREPASPSRTGLRGILSHKTHAGQGAYRVITRDLDAPSRLEPALGYEQRDDDAFFTPAS